MQVHPFYNKRSRMLVNTAWGPIRVSYIASGPGMGEVHVWHNGTLRHHESKLEKLVTTLRGRSKSLSDDFWVVALRDKRKATQATAEAFAQAICSLAARETKMAEMKKAKSTLR